MKKEKLKMNGILIKNIVFVIRNNRDVLVVRKKLLRSNKLKEIAIICLLIQNKFKFASSNVINNLDIFHYHLDVKIMEIIKNLHNISKIRDIVEKFWKKLSKKQIRVFSVIISGKLRNKRSSIIAINKYHKIDYNIKNRIIVKSQYLLSLGTVGIKILIR